MNSSRFMWRVVAIFSILSTCLLTVGFVYAVQDIVSPTADQTDMHPQTTEPLLIEQDEIQIVGLGDSLTKGVGDPTGTGYIGYVQQQLADTLHKPVYITNNLAISGYRTDQLLSDLQGPLANSDAIAEADIIVFTIGGNDLFQFVLEQTNALQQALDVEKLLATIPESLQTMQEILTLLNEMNAQATIVYVGLYNPFLDLDPTRLSSLAIAEWNDQVNRLMNPYPNMLLIPTADLFQKNLLQYLSSDHFHPNQVGYQRIADRVFPSVLGVDG